MKTLTRLSVCTVLGGLLLLGLARVSGHVKSSWDEPALATQSPQDLQRAHARSAWAGSPASSWSRPRTACALGGTQRRPSSWSRSAAAPARSRTIQRHRARAVSARTELGRKTRHWSNARSAADGSLQPQA